MSEFATYDVRISWANLITGDAFTIGESLLDGPDFLAGSYNVDFEGPNDDVSLYCQEISIKRGRTDPFADIQTGTCDLELFDPMDDPGLFDPNNPNSALVGMMLPGRHVRVNATYDSFSFGLTTNTLFRGFISDIEYDQDMQVAHVHCEDLISWFPVAKPIIATITNQVTGFIIDEILTAVDYDGPRSVDVTAGDLVPSFEMDGTVSMGQAIQDLLEAEQGVFFVARDGTLTYLSRTEKAAANRSTVLDTVDSRTGGRPGVSIDSVYNVFTVTKEGGEPQRVFNEVSMNQFGPRAFPDDIVSPYIQSDEWAMSLAVYLLGLYKDPTDPSWGLVISANAGQNAMFRSLTSELFWRVGVADHLYLGEQHDHTIEGIEHHIVGPIHNTTWILSKRWQDQTDYFQIDVSLIGGTDVMYGM